jgi:hypothetical protein
MVSKDVYLLYINYKKIKFTHFALWGKLWQSECIKFKPSLSAQEGFGSDDPVHQLEGGTGG